MRSGLLVILLMLQPLAASNRHARSAAPHLTHPVARPFTGVTTYDVDLALSYVEWTGTKFRGRGKHEGLIRLRSGVLSPCTPESCRGRFVLDMHNMEITDIPVSDAVPRRRLLEHLRSRDFFWTKRYPEGRFVLTHTRATRVRTPGASASAPDGSTLHASGALTLRGITQALEFPARVVQHSEQEIHVRAEVVIDRQRWGIAYRFDPIRNEIVDDEIALVINLVARPRADSSTRKIMLSGDDAFASRDVHSRNLTTSGTPPLTGVAP